MSRSAGCDCGALKVTCSAEPKLISLCHCLACQRRTGSPFGIAAFFNRSDVLVEGASTAYERPSESGFPVRFHFCQICGSTVFWEQQRKPDMIAVAVGCFADPAFPRPTQSVNAQSRHDWVQDGF